MNSGNNGQSTMRKVFIGAAAALAVLALILFAAGRLDGFFSADDIIYDDSSHSVSDIINGENDSSESILDSFVNTSDSTVDSESVPESHDKSGSSAESSIQGAESTKNELDSSESATEEATLRFRNSRLLEQHYQKHGIDMGFASAEEYEKAAAAVVSDPEVLHKIEAEDGDDVYYIESTNEFVVVSTDGYLRTYFYPDMGKDYFDRQ